jgi:SNF2 family DNA or RNA helicase
METPMESAGESQDSTSDSGETDDEMETSEDEEEVEIKQAELQKRRRQLQEKLGFPQSNPGTPVSYIINEARKEHQSPIYIHEHLAGKIKDHQIEGARFMWNLVVGSKDQTEWHGCLLAHIMGLGKTMQVIALLVAIAEAARSKDETISGQIPDRLKISKTLILCPSGLVENWINELSLWTPPDDPVLGSIYKVDRGLRATRRLRTIRQWKETGGVLIIGYALFSKLCDDETTWKLLLSEPNIVVADEAHNLKNPSAKVHRATSNFRTKSRIAMTGSPLMNSVLDYCSMIHWIAPNCLGPSKEFKDKFGKPVSRGLVVESSRGEKREAIKALTVLKSMAAPVIHRLGLATLKAQLPTKKEFVIYVPLTDTQLKAYRTFHQGMMADASEELESRNRAGFLSYMGILSCLLAHPGIFRQQLQERKQAAEEKPAIAIPEHVLSDVLATLSDVNINHEKNSWKICILLSILDEAKRLGEKVLVFSQHIPTLDYLENLCRQKKHNFYRLDGKTPVDERYKHVKVFNELSEAQVYLISTRAGGVGLNIHGATRVVIFDFNFVPTEEQQAIGRAYRIGQTRPVFVYWLITDGTFEKAVQNRAVFKGQLAARLVDKKNPVAWSKRLADLKSSPKVPRRDNQISRFSNHDRILGMLIKSQATSPGILRIMTTDTFEEEEADLEKKLTKEYEKEASDEVAHHRRSANGQPVHTDGEQQQLAPLNTKRKQGQLMAGESRKISTKAQLTKGHKIKLKVPEHMRRGTTNTTFSLPSTPKAIEAPSAQASSSSQLVAPAIKPVPRRPPTTDPSPLVAPIISPTPDWQAGRPGSTSKLGTRNEMTSDMLMPVAGVGTRMGSPDISMRSAEESSRALPPTNLAQNRIEDTINEIFLLLTDAQADRPSPKAPSEIVTEIRSLLHEKYGSTASLELVDHWGLLRSLLSDTQIATDVMRGHMTPSSLVLKKRADLVRGTASPKPALPSKEPRSHHVGTPSPT